MRKIISFLSLLLVVAINSAFAQTQVVTLCLAPIEDAMIHEAVPTTNYGTTQSLRASRHTYGGLGLSGFFTTKVLYKFDLSTIPASAIITGATLTLRTCPACTSGGEDHHYDLGGGTGNSSVLNTVTSTWSEGAVTWNTAPSIGGTTVSVPSFGNGSTAPLVATVNSLMPIMGGSSVTVSFMLSLADNSSYYHGINFASRENTDAAIRPELCVTYVMPQPCTLTNSIAAKYYFNSGNANDDIGSNHGTVSGATLTADRFGTANRAYHFNGAAEIDMGNTAVFQMGTSDFSISVWAKPVATYPATTTNSFTIVGKRGILAPNGGCDPGYGIGFNGALLKGGVGLRPDPPSCGSLVVISSPNVSNTTWHHYVAVYNRSGNMDFYEDNVLVNSTSLSSVSGTGLNGPFGNFKVGSNDVWNGTNGIDEHFIGDIDDIGVYHCALTANQVDALFHEATEPCLTATQTTASSNTIAINTGVDNSNNILAAGSPEQHWTAVGGMPVLVDNRANFPNSQWITTGNQNVTNQTYQRTFCVNPCSGVDSVHFNFRMIADNSACIKLDGNILPLTWFLTAAAVTSCTDGFGGYDPMLPGRGYVCNVTVPISSGSHTLSAEVYNQQGSIQGLDIAGTITGVTAASTGASPIVSATANCQNRTISVVYNTTTTAPITWTVNGVPTTPTSSTSPAILAMPVGVCDTVFTIILTQTNPQTGCPQTYTIVVHANCCTATFTTNTCNQNVVVTNIPNYPTGAAGTQNSFQYTLIPCNGTTG
ncbi:MAG: hypothetical protein RI894_219, partial [Bacteroidota bacterium]